MPGSLHAHILGGTQLKVEVVSDQGATLALVGELHDVEPQVESGGVLERNRALRTNMWAFAKAWYAARASTNSDALALSDPLEQRAALKLVQEAQKAAQKHADAFAKLAQWIADVADDVSSLDIERGWCSSCFSMNDHHKSNRPVGQLPVYVCEGCGSPTLPCVAPGCSNLAVRDRGALRIPQFCAEHRHEIPGFEKSQDSFGELHDYEEFLRFEKPNLDRTSKLVAGVAVLGVAAAPLALIAAPAIGGAIGSLGVFGGLSGAAASSHGLALLGGGAIAAGGLGMAGGTAVVTAVGGALGGALGASISTAYLREDKSFRIELLRPGKGGPPVIVANGFMTERDASRWGGWREIVDGRYAESPIYRLRWGSKELADLAFLAGGAAAKAAANNGLKGLAAIATKRGAQLLANVAGPALMAGDLATNPWHVAKSRASKTGAVLADLLARTDADSYVLIGHSLGARVMAVAAQTLGTRAGDIRIESAHLLGAAISARANWGEMESAVREAVYAYHSTNDAVLKYVYRTAQLGEVAAGSTGFASVTEKLVNIDVSSRVASHSDYLERVRLV